MTSATRHYAEISERILSAFWVDLDWVLASIARSPRSHHFDPCGLRRANFQRFPYHLLYEVNDDAIFLVVCRHHRRQPNHGVERRL
jgi:hypothetical protein